MGVDPTELAGLSTSEVAERVAAHQTNAVRKQTSRSLASIVASNTFTWFNLILGVLLVLMLAYGSWRDALFGFVLVLNTAIGIIQEVRAKHALDRLALISTPRAHVVRDGSRVEVAVDDVVLDDIVLLEAGDQIVADGDVVATDGLEADESLLTGEASTVTKAIGDQVMSGTFVVAGFGAFRATAVGEKSYAQCITAKSRRFTRMHSEVMSGINTILKVVGVVMIPTAALTAWSQLRNAPSAHVGVTDIVAALVAMVPEGLVLLSSVAFAVSTIALARRRVLANELPAVEGLARVDVVCADKTGTLTEPEPAFGRFVPLGATPGDASNSQVTPAPADEAVKGLGAVAAAGAGENATIRAIAAGVPSPEGWKAETRVAFSSARKWSALRVAGHGTWVLGAPDVLAAALAGGAQALEQARDLAAEGRRVLLLARTAAPLAGEQLPAGLEPAGLVLLVERVRPDAPDTIRYLEEQGVTMRVLSGDNPATVAAIAQAAGIPHATEAEDARGLGDGAALEEVLERSTVFGRVMPEQKAAMVQALQRRGHVVAMTGDGVNDVPAVKAADLGIAMGSGAAATRTVAQLVLLDSNFSTLPLVMAEGRRVIANAERVANLFLTKTVWATILALGVALVGAQYPFLPRQITLVGSLTIGIPAFFLALGPNTRRFSPGFVKRVGRFVLPSGAVSAAAVIATYALGGYLGLPFAEVSSLCTIGLTLTGLAVIASIEWPLYGWRLLLVLAMLVAAVGAFAVPWLREFFALTLVGFWPFVATLLIAGVASAGIAVAYRATRS